MKENSTIARFFLGGDNKNFITAYYLIRLSEDNNGFVSYFCSDYKQNILIENSLSIYIESGNIFYDNFNTNKIFFNFLLAQQDETKKIIDKTTSYHRQFEKYINQYLSVFTIDKIEKVDLTIYKHSTYLS